MKEFEVPYPLTHLPTQEELINAAAKALGVKPSKIAQVSIVRRSLDARSREILYRYRLLATTVDEPHSPDKQIPIYQDVSTKEPVLIIGAGPAGMFAALELLQLGKKPIILERGKDVHKRKYDIAAISTKGELNEESNYCFGEGGAGTFSDGKLYTRSNKRGDLYHILKQLVAFGAEESILIDAHPHIGSDRLPIIMEKLRNCIIEHGGEYHFESKVVDLKKCSQGWKVICANGNNFTAHNIILSTGHSATDIYHLFDKNRWQLEAKGFAIGVRVEHPQMLINQIQYHNRYQPYMPPAEYSLVAQVEGRGAFSFCMCPGGLLVPSSTSQGEIVLNGMSNSQRNSPFANAGVVVSVEPEDLRTDSPMQMLAFRESVERAAFNASGSFRAPAQRMTDFVKSRKGAPILSNTLPKSSYAPGTISANLDEILPDIVSSKLKKAFPLFDQKMKGYYTREALLLAVESRTSSPVRIPRDPDSLQSISLPGVYPCGEGAGYAGGIVSSALDGVNCARKIVLD